MFRAGNHGNSFVTELQQMPGCESRTQLVIQDDCIDIFESRLAVKIHQRNGFFLEDSQQIEISPGRTVDDAGNLAFDQKL